MDTTSPFTSSPTTDRGRRRRQIGRRLGAAAAVIGLALGASLAAGGSAGAAPAPGAKYVSIGDSYAVTGGLAPLAPDSTADCPRNDNTYSRIIARAKSYELTDAACGGAKTKDILAPQFDGTPPQIDAITEDTDLVTVSIGGNDSDIFGGTVKNCIMATLELPPLADPCTQRLGDAPMQTVRDVTYPDIRKVLAAVREKAPNAEVILVGYPWLVPAEGDCIPQMPMLAGDTPYFRRLQGELNDAASRAAAETGAAFVDMHPASEGHDACQRPGVRMIEPLLFSDSPVTLHPNAYGQQAMASEILANL